MTAPTAKELFERHHTDVTRVIAPSVLDPTVSLSQAMDMLNWAFDEFDREVKAKVEAMLLEQRATEMALDISHYFNSGVPE